MPAESFCDQIWPLSQKCWPSPGLSYYNKVDEFLVSYSQQLAVLFISTVVDTFHKAGLRLRKLSIA
jgi:hypothetical protein